MVRRSKKVGICATANLLLSLMLAGSAWAFGKVGTPCDECHRGAKTFRKGAAGSAASTYKFHNGTTTECIECHATGKGPDLREADAGSTCLRCHEAPPGTRSPNGYYVATSTMDLRAGQPPVQLTPGGDFGWLKKSYSWRTAEGVKSSPGERHGHNIVAVNFGYMPDTRLLSSSNGRYPSSAMSCVSCHDPHGRITGTAYRMLAGAGYRTRTAPGVVFTANPPVAVAPRDYNRPENRNDTRVAYGTGMSEWCGNCHTSGCDGRTHPSGTCANCSVEVMSNYNAYVMSGNINGRADTAFSSLIPFEEGTDDLKRLASHAQSTGSYTRGTEHGARVMCLTCHRAHASGWNSMARWNMETDFIVHGGKYPGTDNGSPPEFAQGRTSAETRRALYERPVSFFAVAQRGLCNKCHIRD